MKPNPLPRRLALLLSATLALPATAATLYWDVNGATAGSGNNGGLWSATPSDTGYWSTDATGQTNNSTTFFSNGDSVVFSAGTDGVGTWQVLVSGTVSTPSITFQEGGTQTISGGTISLPAGGLTINATAVPDTSGNGKTISSKLSGTGNLSLALNGDLSATGGGSNTHFSLTSTTSDFTGTITITDGLLNWANNASLGNAANKLVLNGGGIIDPGLNRTTARAIEVGAAGGVIRLYGNTTSTLTGPLSSTAATTVRRTDAGTLILQGDGSGFTGTFNTQGGDTIFESANWAAMDYVAELTAGTASGFRSGTLTTINSLTTARNVYLFNNTGLNIDTGTLNFGDAAGLWLLNSGAYTGAWLTSSSGTLTVNGGTTNTGTLAAADQQIRVRIQDFNGSTPLALVKNNDNQLALNQPNTYSGGTTINGGRINADHAAALGTGTVTVNNGGQAYLTQAATYANNFVIHGNGTAEAAGTLGAIRFQNNIISGSLTVASAARIGGYAGATGTLTGALLGTADLEINGGGLNGTVVLAGNTSGYSGTLTLSAGALVLNSGVAVAAPVINGGTLTANTGSTITGSLVTSFGAPATLNLGGSVTGSVTIDDLSTLGLRGGAVGGGLTVGFDALSTNNLNFSSTLAVAGPLTVHGTQTVYLNSVPAPGSTTNLLTYSSASDPDDANVLNNFLLDGAANWRSVAFNNTGTALTLSLGGQAHKWLGNNPANPTFFDTTTTNWSSTDNRFFNGDAITFDDTAASFAPTLQGLYAPHSVTFNNTSNSYTLGGTAGHGFTGSTSITKNGTGTVTMAGYSHNYTGPVAINAGILRAASNEILGLTSGVTIASGAQLDLGGMSPGAGGSGRAYSFTISGDGGDGPGGSGAITNSAGPVYANSGILNLTLAGNAEIGGTGTGDGAGRFDVGRSEGTYSHGAINGNGHTLTKVGDNQMVFRAPAANITYVVDAGRLSFEDYDSASGTNPITVNNAAALGTYGNRTIANAVTFNGASSLVGIGGGTGSWTGTLTFAGLAHTLQTDDQLVLHGPLAGAATLTKTGGSNLFLENPDNSATFSGRWNLTAGTTFAVNDLSFGAVPAAPTADAITLNNARLTTGDRFAQGTLTLAANRGITLAGNAWLDPRAGGALTINGPVTGTGSIFKDNNSGTLVFNGPVTTDGSFEANAGTVTFTNNLNLTGEFRVGTNLVANIQGPAFSAATGLKAWTGTTNINVTSGHLGDIELGQADSQAHALNLQAGTLTVANDFRIGHYPNETSTATLTGGSLSQPDTVTNVADEGQANLFLGIDGTGSLTISGGTVNTTSIVLDGRGATAGTDTLRVNSGGTLNVGQWGIRVGTAGTTSYSIQLAGGTIGTVSSNTTPGYDWASSWSSPLNMTLVAGTNTTFNTGGNDITLSGVLSGGTTGLLTKTGAGSLVMNGTNTFTGSLAVNAGNLVGTGTVVGAVNLGASATLGAGTSANPGTIGTLKLGRSGATTTINGAIVLDLDAASAAPATNDRLTVTGNILFNAGSKIAPRFSGVATAGLPLSYTLLTYSGTLTGTPTIDNQFFATYRTPTTSLSTGTGSNSSVTLNVTFNTANLFWSSNPANSNWDINTSLDWDHLGTADDRYFDGDSVTFDSNGKNSAPITIVAAVAPAALTVSSDLDYTFQGAAITGTTGLTKNGFGTLTLLNDNSYTGLVNIQDGIVQVGDGGTTGTLGGAGSITVAPNAELAFRRSDALAPGRAIVGSGLVSLAGGGSLTTVAGNDADFLVSGSTLFARGGTWDTSWSPGASIILENGATLDTTTHSMGGLGTAVRPSSITLDQGTTWILNNEHHLPTGSLNLNGAAVTGPGELRGGGTISHSGDTTSTISTNVNLYATILFDVADGTQPDDLLITGNLTSGGNLSKYGAGTLALTGQLASTGTLSVDAGTLALRMPATTPVTLANNLGGFGGTLANETGQPLVLTGDAASFGGTLDANGRNVTLAGPTAGSGTGGTIALEGATLTAGADATEGVLFYGTFAGGAINTTPLPNTSPTTGSTAALHAAIPENTTVAYDGQIYLTAGQWSFGENIDDDVYVNINGVTLINDNQWNVPVSGTFTAPADGWYPITLRGHNGGGPGGPVDAWATAGIGIGIKTGAASTNVADYVPFTIGALGTKCRVDVPVTTFTMAGGLTTGGGVTNTINTNGRTLTINGPIDGPDPLVKSGAGSLTLNGAGSLTGPVTLQQGTLVLGPTGSLASAASLAVNSGTTLAGTGTAPATTVNGSLTPAGTLATGTLTVAGNLSFGPSSVFYAEINSSTTTADKLAVAGNVTINPSATILFGDLGSTPLPGPVKLVLIEYSGTLSNTFAGRTEGSNVVIGPNTFKLSYHDTVGPNMAVTLSIGGSAYDTWAANAGLDGSPGKEAGFNQDPEGDGLSNGLEWILGGNPLAQDAAGRFTATATATTGLTLTFTREEDAIAESTLTVEWDADLAGTWTSVPIGPTNSGPDANGVTVTINTAASPDAVTVNIPAARAVNGKLFARLKATRP